MSKAVSLYARARAVSASKPWVRLLNTLERRMGFEDGFVRGWTDAETRERKRKREALELEARALVSWMIAHKNTETMDYTDVEDVVKEWKRGRVQYLKCMR